MENFCSRLIVHLRSSLSFLSQHFIDIDNFTVLTRCSLTNLAGTASDNMSSLGHRFLQARTAATTESSPITL